jgi:hypothetical protein
MTHAENQVVRVAAGPSEADGGGVEQCRRGGEKGVVDVAFGSVPAPNAELVVRFDTTDNGTMRALRDNLVALLPHHFCPPRQGRRASSRVTACLSGRVESHVMRRGQRRHTIR